jgi:hypothetical protein
MPGLSLWTEHQVVPVAAPLGESMSGISVSRPGIAAAAKAPGKYVRTIGSSRQIERESGRDRSRKYVRNIGRAVVSSRAWGWNTGGGSMSGISVVDGSQPQPRWESDRVVAHLIFRPA